MKYQIHNNLLSILENSFLEIDLKSTLEIINNFHKDSKIFGDYSTNLPLKLSKTLKKNPMELAEKIKDIIMSSDSKVFEKVEVARPGFINFFLSKDFLVEEYSNFLDKDYVPRFNHLEKSKINYEYISANPTGWLHMGHARNAIVGDVVTNMLIYVGNEVYLEYYINDYGSQIDNLAASIRYYYDLKLGQNTETDEATYKGQEIIDFAEKLFLEYGSDFSEKNDKNFEIIKEKSLTHFLDEIKKTVHSLKIKPFDEYVSEAGLYANGKVEEYVNKLRDSGKTYMKDNALWLKTTDFGDDKDRVLMKENGEFTYLVGDIANHGYKIEKGFTKMIDLWGKDHHGYETRVKASLSFLGYDNYLDIDYINMVHISNNGAKVKMSKRAGTSLTINNLLQILPVDVLRYFMISKSKDQGLEIDIANVTDNSNSNPFYYLQYSNARANQLLEKFQGKMPTNIDNFKNIGLNDSSERNLLKKVLELEEMVTISLAQREPSILINYSKELASSFHSFYNNCPILTDDNQLTQERIFVVKVFKNSIERLFKLIGIDILNKM